MSDSVSRADKLAIAKKKLKEFEARRQREWDSSPAPSIASTVEHGELVVNNGRLSVNSDHSQEVINGENHIPSCCVDENNDAENIYRQQPYVSVLEGSITNSSPALSASNNPLRNLVAESNTSNNSSPVPQHSIANGNLSSAPLSHNASNQHSSPNIKMAQLQHERDAAVAAYEQVSAQLEQLRMHYTQLHAAYSSVSNSGVHSDADRQIQQLQSALAVLIEEKTALQSEMRSVKNDLQQERITNESLKANLKSFHDDESKKLQTRLLECEHLLSARSIALDGLRKSEANAQAQLLTVQHERSEAQARLKAIAREKNLLEIDMKQLRKELHMKEIYLKQLGPQGIVSQASDEKTIRELHDRIDELQAHLGLLTSERDQLHHNSQEHSRHFESCRMEFMCTRDKLAAELAEAVSTRDAALSRVKELEDDVSVLQKELCQKRSTEMCETTEINGVLYTEEDIIRKVNEARWHADAEWQRKFDEEGKVVDTMMRSKDQIIFEREQTISELQMRLRLIEERTAETRANGSDLLSLSEQLQNEKATVSRAVAQNKELKEQLLETEDRLVAVTEEKLNSELARQTAEHQVKELMKRLDSEHTNSEYGSALVPAKSSNTLEAVLHPSVSLEPSRSSEEWDESERDRCESVADRSCIDTSREREHMLETQLEMANQQLEEIRADLRRSHTRNEEMNQILRQNAEDENQNSIHVELGQAVTRIHELAAENQQLRENIERLNRQQSFLEQSLQEKSKMFDEIVLKNVQATEALPPTTASLEQQEAMKRSANVDSENWARFELEKRFAQAMNSNAELRDTLDTLEHINMQLQLENDTIADHVVLYQHQRRLIRERLRAKDEQLAAMEADRLRTLERCKELQRALMDVLAQTGALKEYEIRNRSQPTTSRKPRRKVARSYSHSTVDELSGDEDVIVDGSDLEVPPRLSIDSIEEIVIAEEGGSKSCTPPSQINMQRARRTSTPSPTSETDAAVRRILQILTDISKPPLPTAMDKLHCTQCIGDIQTL